MHAGDAGAVPAGSTNDGCRLTARYLVPTQMMWVQFLPPVPEMESVMRQFVQCRLRRRHTSGAGYSELVTYLPTHGTNGRAVAPGCSVTLNEDSDRRPWMVFSACDRIVDARFIQRKRDEASGLAKVIR